ncbi:MAG: hypothetical protein AB7K04_13515 [Pseudorhodoplanes sp.]|jgi:predicted transcriptional regulator|nr:conserved hypothetical protein [Hyphomicrobiales bacterium]CAH1702212.1 ROS/MUCR transcriptional regulator family protein [Hyphomicrobiales bacterium]CAI0346415.1 conserved hypothetical protein [Hyphomicrobiales bacterium]
MASDRSGISEIAAMTTEIVGGWVRNPNTTIPKDDLIPFIKDVHDTMTGIVKQDIASGLVQRAGSPAPLPEIAPPVRAALPAVTAPAAPSKALAPEAMKSLEGSRAFIPVIAHEGQIVAERVWPTATPAMRKKFMEIMKEHNIPTRSDGTPVPRTVDGQHIADKRMTVVDPIGGGRFKMLRRHIEVSYGMDYPMLLAMFKLSKEQLPHAGPAYSEQKAMQARASGLGKHSKSRDGGARKSPRAKKVAATA